MFSSFQPYLVGGLEHGFYEFPFSWEFHRSQLTFSIIFQGGRLRPPTRYIGLSSFINSPHVLDIPMTYPHWYPHWYHVPYFNHIIFQFFSLFSAGISHVWWHRLRRGKWLSLAPTSAPLGPRARSDDPAFTVSGPSVWKRRFRGRIQWCLS